MGESKWRRDNPAQVVDVLPYIRDVIAKIVRSVEFRLMDCAGGTCMYQNLLGLKALQHVGVRATLLYGAALYRCGPDTMVDCISFCGPGNRALYGKDGTPIGHAWLREGDNLVDFSVGSWRDSGAVDGKFDRLPNGQPLPPPTWTAPPLPNYFWEP